VVEKARSTAILFNKDPDTPANRALLQGVGEDSGALLGADRFGNQWFARLNADGTQTWVQIRNGTIINGGMNQTPRPFNPGTGLSGGGS
jgi:filamentous hemagglutinin